jgi:nitrogen regulation protein NR(I)
MAKILIVDDEPGILALFQDMLVQEGYEVETADQGETALSILNNGAPDVLVMDIRMPGLNGLETLQRIKTTHPKLPVIIMTGFGTTDAAIEATKLGAFDYQVKPFNTDEMLRAIAEAASCVRLMGGHVKMGAEAAPDREDAIVGVSPVMQNVYKAIGRVAQTDATVLIRGETGSGKELVARAIYHHSLRAEQPLVALNCIAIPETLLESELFGHEKGAFTGAHARRIGKFEQAAGGTVFLDEIGDLPITIQAKILRFLQDRTFQRVGGNEPLQSDVRILAATNCNLEKAIAEGKFREDLYHRLNVITITLPSLRERRDDIPLLVDYFLRRFSKELGVDQPFIAPSAMDALRAYEWPGNVRDLEHCIHRAIIFTKGYAIQAEDVRRAIERPVDSKEPGAASSPEDLQRSLVHDFLASDPGQDAHGKFMDQVDKLLVIEALRLTNGNQTSAAKILGMTRPTLHAKIQKYGLHRETVIKDK